MQSIQQDQSQKENLERYSALLENKSNEMEVQFEKTKTSLDIMQKEMLKMQKKHKKYVIISIIAYIILILLGMFVI